MFFLYFQDVKTLQLTPNPVKDTSASDDSPKRSQFVCPLTLKEMSGTLPFVYLATCGDVFSTAGLKAVSSPSSSSSSTPPKDGDAKSLTEPCPQCAKPFSRTEDVRTINPSEEEQERMMERMLAAKAAAKTKKRKGVESTSDDVPTKRSKVMDNETAQPAPSMNPSVSSIAKKVTQQLAEEEKKRKANMSEAVASLYQSKNDRQEKQTFLTMNTFTRVSPRRYRQHVKLTSCPTVCLVLCLSFHLVHSWLLCNVYCSLNHGRTRVISQWPFSFPFSRSVLLRSLKIFQDRLTDSPSRGWILTGNEVAVHHDFDLQEIPSVSQF